MEITPTPTDEEAAAIVAAVTVGLPASGTVEADSVPSPRWRFSGRWWNRGPAVKRRRPSL